LHFQKKKLSFEKIEHYFAHKTNMVKLTFLKLDLVQLTQISIAKVVCIHCSQLEEISKIPNFLKPY
jgi:hypothetical protein